MRLGKQEIFHASIIYAKIDYTTKQLYKHTSRFCESQVFAKKIIINRVNELRTCSI